MDTNTSGQGSAVEKETGQYDARKKDRQKDGVSRGHFRERDVRCPLCCDERFGGCHLLVTDCSLIARRW